jgi:hypothetical protein
MIFCLDVVDLCLCAVVKRGGGFLFQTSPIYTALSLTTCNPFVYIWNEKQGNSFDFQLQVLKSGTGFTSPVLRSYTNPLVRSASSFRTSGERFTSCTSSWTLRSRLRRLSPNHQNYIGLGKTYSSNPGSVRSATLLGASGARSVSAWHTSALAKSCAEQSAIISSVTALAQWG